MALIKCPECGKEISDKAELCIHCGLPLIELKKQQKKISKIQKKDTYNAPTYGMERRCPVCGSDNFHAFVEEIVVREGKTKSKTTVNLNPLKPFTLFNHKEEKARKPKTRQASKFICDDCGKIFK